MSIWLKCKTVLQHRYGPKTGQSKRLVRVLVCDRMCSWLASKAGET